MSANVGEIIGLNGNALSSNSFFAIARGQPGEITIANTVGSQSALTASQQGVYTCRIPLQNGVRREINIGIYPSGFNSELLLCKYVSYSLCQHHCGELLLCKCVS